jgi:peptide/nickel transport system permease protein
VIRALAAMVATVLVATALGHVFLTATDGERLTSAIAGTPRFLVDAFVHHDLGVTAGKGCNQRDEYHPLCAWYGPSTVAAMLRERMPIDVYLLFGGFALGVLGGVAGGRWCAIRPDARRTKALHLVTAFQLSSPVFFQALLVLFYFSSNVSGFVRLPFLSGQADYAPPIADPVHFLKAMWIPWLLAALPLAAYVLRITEATLRDELDEDFVRTARAKGLSERRVINRHALPVAVPSIAVMAGVNVSTLLLNVAVIEYAYSIPGLFRVINTAVRAPADIPVLQGLVIEGVVLVVAANAIADAVQSRLDPRLAARGA